MNVSLSPELEQLIQDKVKSGLYLSEGEVIGEALRLLEERDWLRHRKREDLRKQIAIGLEQADRGESQPLDMEEIKAEVRRRLEEQRGGP